MPFVIRIGLHSYVFFKLFKRVAIPSSKHQGIRTKSETFPFTAQLNGSLIRFGGPRKMAQEVQDAPELLPKVSALPISWLRLRSKPIVGECGLQVRPALATEM